MKNFKVSVTLFYLLIITHICMGKFLRQSVPRRKKDSSNGALKPRIIGGRPTRPGEFPYQLQMRLDTYHVCGATLAIAPTTGKQIVITAAHCINQPLLSQYNIRAGSIFIDGSDFQTLTVKRAVIHPKYAGGYRDDLAILFLDGEFQLNKTLQPLDLPGVNEIVKKEITVTGWGRIDSASELGTLPKRLQALVMPVITNRKCRDIWKNRLGTGDDFIVPTHLCAGKLGGSQSSCNGDSGGPAMAVDKTGKKFLAGVVSFGHLGCASKGFPAVFTRVSKFVKWLDAVSKQFENE